MPYDSSLSEFEASDEFSQSSPEVQRALSREYISQNGTDEVLNQYQTAISDPEYQSLPVEQQDLFRKSYADFYGVDLPLEDVSFGTDVKDVVMSGLAGTSAIPKAVATVAGWFDADESKEYLLDMAKTVDDYYRSGISKQGKDVQAQPFLSDQDGKWFGDNAVKKVFMVSAESLPLMIATAPIGGSASAALSKAKFLPDFIRAVEGTGAVGKWSHNLVTFGASEAGTSALVSAADAGERIAKMPDSVLAKSPVYQELIRQGMDPAAARAEVRGIVEEETVKTQFAATLAGGALAPGGAMTKLFQKGPRAGIVRETAEGVATEGLQEAGQGTLEQLGENVTTQRNIDPTQSLTENLGEAAALSAASGGVMGGGMSGGAKLMTLGQAQQAVQDIPLGADPEQTVAQIEAATTPTTDTPPRITLGELTPDEIEGIAAVGQRMAGADLAEIQRVQRDVLPLLREKNPMVAPHVEQIVNERFRALQAQQAVQFEQQVPVVEADLAAAQPDLAADDLMDDWADSEMDVQAQADARGRSVRFEALKQSMADRLTAADELAGNTVGRPSTAEESAGVLAAAGPSEIETRAGRQADIEEAFARVDRGDDLMEQWAEPVPERIPQEVTDDSIQATAPPPTGTVDTAPDAGTAPEGNRTVDETPGIPGDSSRDVRSADTVTENTAAPLPAGESAPRPADSRSVVPFEEAQKYDIYTTQIRDRGEMFAVRGDMPRGGGDELFGTFDEAQKYSVEKKARDEANTVFRQKEKAAQVERDKIIAERTAALEDLDGFDTDMPPMRRGKVISALSKQVRTKDGRVITKRDLIRERVKEGYTVNEDGNLEAPDGGFLGPDVLTKTGIDYARHLTTRSIAADQPVNTEPTPAQAETVNNPDSIVNGQLINTTPTEAQKSAENYKTAHTIVDGLKLSIENHVGSIRSGTDPSGKKWSQEMKADYGKILGTKGYDKDHLDIFVKPGYTGEAADVFVVNQYNADGTFDEHKTVVGPATEQEALDLYRSNYEDGWAGGRSVTRVPMETFRKWATGTGPAAGPLVRRGTVTAPVKSLWSEIKNKKVWKVPLSEMQKAAPRPDYFSADSHRYAVRGAMNIGRFIPKKVLAEYPDMVAEMEKEVDQWKRIKKENTENGTVSYEKVEVGSTIDESKQKSPATSTPKSFPAKDADLSTVEELTERIKSIEDQRERLNSVLNPRDHAAHQAKIAKLTTRHDELRTRRAKLVKEQRTAPSDLRGKTTESEPLLARDGGYKYRVGIAPVDERVNNLKYRIEVAREDSDNWASANMGYLARKEYAPKRFVDRKGNLEKVEAVDPEVKKLIAYELGDKETRRAKDEAARKQRDTLRLKEQDLRARFDTAVSGLTGKFRKQEYTQKVAEGEPVKETAQVFGSFGYVKRDRGYDVVHPVSGLLVDNFKTVSTARSFILAADALSVRFDKVEDAGKYAGIVGKLNDAFDSNHTPDEDLVKQLEATRPTPDPDGGPDITSRQSSNTFGDPDPKESSTVQAGVGGKSPVQAATFLINNAPNPAYRMIAEKVRGTLQRLEASGIRFEPVRVAHLGDRVPSQLRYARGITNNINSSVPPYVEIWLNGSDVTGKVGLSYEVTLHELVHAATQSAVHLGMLKENQNNPIAKHVQDLTNITNRIIDHINSRIAKDVDLTEFEKYIQAGSINALEDPHEVLAWTLSNPRMQEYLETIPLGKSETLWSQFVTAVRNLLGLDPTADTALSEVLRIGNEIMGAPVNQLLHMIENSRSIQTVWNNITSSQQTGETRATNIQNERTKRPETDRRTETNMDGRSLVKTWRDNPRFQKWFGDSRAIEPDSEDLIVFYHGSPTFGAPSGSYTLGENRGKPKSPMSALGHWFTEDRTEAIGYSRGTGDVESVALRLENPYVIDGYEMPILNTVEEAQDFAGRLRKYGHDGIYFPDQQQAIVFDANQAKSIDKNSGEFSRELDSILESRTADDPDKLDQLVIDEILSNGRVNIGLKVPKSVRIWRGVSQESGEGGATYGTGLYTTRSKKEAQDYAGKTGRVVEMDISDLPQNPLRFKTINDFQIWLQQSYGVLGFNGPREFNKKYPDLRDFIRGLGEDIDGIQIGEGSDSIFVNYGGRKLTITDILSSETTRREFIAQGGALIAWAAAGGDVTALADTRSFNDVLAQPKQTVHGALSWIASNSPSPRFRTMAEDLLTLLPDDGSVTLNVTDTRTNAAGTATTDRRARSVAITLFGDGHNEATLLHESWHAAVLARYDMLNYYLANPGKMGNHQAEAALKQYRAVWEEFGEAVRAYGKGRDDLPVWLRVPAENPDEFLTYALTHPETIDWMSERTYRGRTLRERFLHAIRGFFARVFRRAPTWLDAANMATGDLIEAMRKDAPNFEASARILELVGRGTDVAKAARQIRNEPAFRKWFEGSKVVDEDGDPLVVYHGTHSKKFNEFDTSGDSGLHPTAKLGAFFTSDKNVAGTFGDRIEEVYIDIKNPLRITAQEYFEDFSREYVSEDTGIVDDEELDNEIAERVQSLIDMAEYDGHDGIIVEADSGEGDIHPHYLDRDEGNWFELTADTYIVFRPTQIKSIFNEKWDPKNPNILESRLYAQSATSAPPDRIDRFLAANPSLSDQWERFIYNVIDKDDPRRRVLARADVVNLSENLSENTDILTIERLRGKKTAEEALRFWEDKAVPLLRKLAGAKLAAADLDEYAHAKHAPERNKRMQQVNAKAYIDRIAEHLNSAERQALDDEIIDIRSDVLMTGGTRADRQDRYLQVLDRLMNGIAAQRADVAARQQTLTARVFTAAEIAKGTPANLQKRIDARTAHLDEIQAVADRWNLESPRFAGITDQEAADIVRKWQADPRFAALTDAHARLLEFGQMKLDILRESGQLTDVEYKSLVDGYDFYVPLMRDVETDDRPATGRVTGPTGSPIKVAKGSMLEVVHILAHSIQNVQTAINRKHKADAGRVLYNFAVENPDAGITVGKQKKEPRHDSEGNVVMFTAPREADNELYIRVDGERYTLTFDTKNATTKRFLESIKEADAGLSGPMQAVGKLVRFLAKVNTTLSPEFVITNFTRDIQTAGVHMEDTEASGLQGKVLRNVFPAIKGILGAEYGRANTYWGRVYRDFAANGGKIGWMQSYDGITDLAKQIESTMDLHRDGHYTKKSLRTIADLITRTNTAVENGVRLAVYDQLIKIGATPSRAALAASNLTVDFTRRGAYSPVLNSLYMFFNAGVQGNVRMIKAVARSSRVRAITGGIVLAGFALQFLAYATGGDDETGQPYIDGIKDFIRERNMIIMYPGTDGKFQKIPMPYGYNLFYNLGAGIAKAAHALYNGRKYEPGKEAVKLVTMVMNSFNPLQAATVTQALSPTVLDPFVMVGENKNWAGMDLMPKESPFGPGKADAYRAWKSTSGIAKSVAQGLHRLTGGKGEYDNTAGIDVSPEVLELMYETFTGSAGRFLKDMTVTPIQAVTGDEPVDPAKVPFLRRAYGEWSPRSISTRYYEEAEQVERFRKDYLAADGPTRKELSTDPRYKMVSYTREVENTLDKLRDARNKAEAAGRPTKSIDERILKLQTEYLKRGK